MRRLFTAVVLALCVLTSISAPGEEQAIVIHRKGERKLPIKASVTFCTEIQNKECESPSERFSISDGKVYCHTTITGATSYIEVKHRWYHGDKLVQEIRLPVRSSRWRTWSLKTLEKGAEGTWKVEVLAGDVLIGEGSFQVTPQEEGN
ncbi:MAG: DUF2914 domain-containing protein [Deltaproteobacteria bacterium]|nr:MAG: DUF2914 domain-containing protein [Deltaproteobacteria bacterium]